MAAILIIALSLFVFAQAQVQILDKDGVLILRLENFDDALRQNKHLLVDFFAPWCKPCMEFLPEYYSIARILSANPRNTIRIASYDTTQVLYSAIMNFKDQEDKMNTRFTIHSYPTFIFFIDGIPFTYDGNQRKADALITWMRQIIEAPLPTELRSYDEINDFISSNDLSVLYFGKDNIFNDKNFWTFFQVTKMGEEGVYGYSMNEQLIKKAGAKQNTLIVYNNLKDQGSVRRDFNQAFTRENVLRFIIQHTLPDVPPLNQKAENLIFQGNSPAFILFTNHEEKSTTAEKNFIEVAQPFKKHYFFTISKITDDLFFEVLDRLGADDKSFPQLIVVQQPQKLIKFRYEGDVKLGVVFKDQDFSVNGIKKFVFDFRQGKLQRFIKSEPIPQGTNDKVKKIVALNFEEEVLKTKKDLIVMYQSNWCQPCKQFKPQFEIFAYQMSSNPNLAIGAFNVGENEQSIQYRLSELPSFQFFKGNEKVKKPVEFRGNRTLAQLIEFAKNETTYEWVEPYKVDT